MRFVTRLGILSAVAALTWPAPSLAAEMRGVTATEIKIGQTMPYSGPVSAFGALGGERSAISRCSTSAAASTAARSI
jgi:branched-chain amino acid transport system substrate-binding protein